MQSIRNPYQNSQVVYFSLYFGQLPPSETKYPSKPFSLCNSNVPNHTETWVGFNSCAIYRRPPVPVNQWCRYYLEYKFYEALLAFLGDNLASNAVGGFKESFSATYRCCRTCLATNSSRKEIFDSNMFQLRSDDAHLQYCNDLNRPLKDHISTTYGINRF